MWPTSTMPTSWARARRWWTASPTWSPSSRIPALDFRSNRAEGDDLLGDAYEYLMRHFATEIGQEQGAVLHPGRSLPHHGQGDRHRAAPSSQDQTIYDPTCGSGSLLLKAADEAPHGHHHLRAGDGQRHRRAGQDEHDPARQPDGGNLEGQHPLQPALQGNRRQPQDLRLRGGQSAVFHQGLEQRLRPGQRSFTAASSDGIPPAKNGDYAFLLHLLALAEEHRQGRDHSAARRAVPGQRRGRDPQEHHPARATSRASSACRPTCFTAPASRPASSCWTRKTPRPARASS